MLCWFGGEVREWMSGQVKSGQVRAGGGGGGGGGREHRQD